MTLAPRPISVMHFSNECARGGVEEHILTLLRGLDRRRFCLHLVCTPELAGLMKGDLPSDVEVIPLRLDSPSRMGAGISLYRIIRERRIDILHSHLFTASLYASPVGRLAHVPVVVETQHVREQWRKGWLKSHYFVDRWVGRFVHRYVAVSEANARYLAEEKGLPEEKIVVIRNGCNLDRFRAAMPGTSLSRGSLGIPPEHPVLVVVGRLEPQKGHHILLSALPLVRQEFPNLRLICVGDGSLRAELGRQAESLGLGDYVMFAGFQPNVPDFLALADVSVLPSYYEGLPLVAIESLAAGTPVVATAVDGTPEVVIHGQTGLTVPPGEPQPLAEAIQTLLRDSGLRRKLGRAGQQHVLANFGSERQVRETEEFYARCLGLEDDCPASRAQSVAGVS